MDTILMRYRSLDNEYLIFDTHKYHATIDAHTVRTICSQNCGLRSSGIVAGPFICSDGRLEMKVFAPDGEERPLDQEAKSAGLCYLHDAGYLRRQREEAAGAKAVGKVFLSESFVNTFLYTA